MIYSYLKPYLNNSNNYFIHYEKLQKNNFKTSFSLK